jgi:hypothetical protein
MKALKLALAALAVAAVVPLAALADPTNGTDKANGARACTQLRTSMGALFAQTYGVPSGNTTNAYGKCVVSWTQSAHLARHAALTACRASGKRGAVLRTCVASRVGSQLAAQVTATKNAAQECKAERTGLGDGAFATKYGTNGNKADAFGKCVSAKRSHAGENTQAGRLTATLSGTAGSGTFTARINVKQGQLCYTLDVTGLTGITAAHIHVKPSGDIVVPLTAPTNGSSSGCVTVAAALLQQILQHPSNYYVNVHTTAAPAGAIMGDLTK